MQPSNLVGAIANEAGIDSGHIGRIDIHDTYSTVELPPGMPLEIQRHLRDVWVCGQKLAIEEDAGPPRPGAASKRGAGPAARSPRPKKKAHRKGPKRRD